MRIAIVGGGATGALARTVPSQEPRKPPQRHSQYCFTDCSCGCGLAARRARASITKAMSEERVSRSSMSATAYPSIPSPLDAATTAWRCSRQAPDAASAIVAAGSVEVSAIAITIFMRHSV